MHPALTTAENAEVLSRRKRDDTPYDYETLFPITGFWSRRAAEKKLLLLRRIDEQLRKMLWKDERVVFLTSGVAYSFWESYFFGLPMYYLNRRALVITSERIILIQIDSRRRPRELRSQVLLRSVSRIGRTAFGNTSLKLTSGRTYVFAYLPRRDRKALQDVIHSLQPAAQRSGGASLIEQLCPHCYVPLEGHPTECNACHGALKSPLRAGLLSLLFPGIGDIYLGHLRFAVFELLTAGLIWFGVLSASGLRTDLAPIVVLFVIMHGGDAISTWHVARMGHYPAGEEPMASTRQG